MADSDRKILCSLAVTKPSSSIPKPVCEVQAINFAQQGALLLGERAIRWVVHACAISVNRIVCLVFGEPFRNSPYRFSGLRAILGEFGGARVSGVPVVDRVSRYPNVRARPEPLLRPAAHALAAVLAVAPVVAANVGPLEGERESTFSLN